MNSESIFKQVLFIGPDYKNHKGGMGAVLESYSQNIVDFKFIATYPSQKQKYKLSFIPKFFISLCLIFWTLITDKNIKIVHLHSAAKGSLWRKYSVFLLSKYFFKKRVIFHSHGGLLRNYYMNSNRLKKWFIEHFFNKVDLIVCLSSQWEFFFKEYFDPKEVEILENIIPRNNQSSVKVETSILRLLYLGTICKEKGLYDLMDIVHNNVEEFTNKVFIDIGGVGNDPKLIAILLNPRYHNIIKYHGWVSGETKKELLNSCSVYILPSYFEALPISILEAMSFGKPVISTNIGGIPEVVKNYENGFLVEPGDKVDLLQKINFFSENSSEISKMGIISKNIVEPYYADNVIEKLKDMYVKLLVV